MQRSPDTMIETHTLLIFATVVLALLLLPGPNMAFVLAHGATHGFMGGAAAGLGIGLADLVLTVLTATGVTAAVMAWPPSFDLIRCGRSRVAGRSPRRHRQGVHTAARRQDRALGQMVVAMPSGCQPKRAPGRPDAKFRRSATMSARLRASRGTLPPTLPPAGQTELLARGSANWQHLRAPRGGASSTRRKRQARYGTGC